jgi:hypothetical protein
MRHAGVAPAVERVATPACTGNDPNTPGRALDGACPLLAEACTAPGQIRGSLSWIWQRPTTGNAPWQRTGATCATQPTDTTTAPTAPVITPAMLRHAFRDLPFARPHTHVQPEGNITLVNLPTYYQVRWPTTGYQPGETTTITLLGATITIRPTATAYTYDFGDGTHHGPTTDPGGTYPTGHITHTYLDTNPGEPSHITATYSGQYKLPHGTWQDIGITIPVTGPTTTVTVKQAHNELIDGPR